MKQCQLCFIKLYGLFFFSLKSVDYEARDQSRKSCKKSCYRVHLKLSHQEKHSSHGYGQNDYIWSAFNKMLCASVNKTDDESCEYETQRSE